MERGVILWNEDTNAPSRVHIYNLIGNINIIVFGTAIKHQDELNSVLLEFYTYFSIQ